MINSSFYIISQLGGRMTVPKYIFSLDRRTFTYSFLRPPNQSYICSLKCCQLIFCYHDPIFRPITNQPESMRQPRGNQWTAQINSESLSHHEVVPSLPPPTRIQSVSSGLANFQFEPDSKRTGTTLTYQSPIDNGTTAWFPEITNRILTMASVLRLPCQRKMTKFVVWICIAWRRFCPRTAKCQHPLPKLNFAFGVWNFE